MIYILRVFFLVLLFSSTAQAIRLKDIANVRGVRDNQLIGYGLVVGLKGTGDSKSEFTNKSMVRMLDKLGVKVEDTDVAKKNVAAVLITATLPPFARAGNKMDVPSIPSVMPQASKAEHLFSLLCARRIKMFMPLHKEQFPLGDPLAKLYTPLWV